MSAVHLVPIAPMPTAVGGQAVLRAMSPAAAARLATLQSTLTANTSAREMSANTLFLPTSASLSQNVIAIQSQHIFASVGMTGLQQNSACLTPSSRIVMKELHQQSFVDRLASSEASVRSKKRASQQDSSYQLHGVRKHAGGSVARRNERERNRVKQVNMGFEELRRRVPDGGDSKNKKMSKVDTLKSAAEYIRHLQELLDSAEALESSSSSSPPSSSSMRVCEEASSPLACAASVGAEEEGDHLTSDLFQCSDNLVPLRTTTCPSELGSSCSDGMHSPSRSVDSMPSPNGSIYSTDSSGLSTSLSQEEEQITMDFSNWFSEADISWAQLPSEKQAFIDC